jgi:hypothetical protein
MSYHRRAPARNIAGADMVLPPGKQFYTAVKFLASGIRLRLAVVGPRDAAQATRNTSDADALPESPDQRTPLVGHFKIRKAAREVIR